MKNTFQISFVIIGLLVSASVSAQTSAGALGDAMTSAFQKFVDVSAPQIKVPTVVEVSLANDFSNRFDFAVLDKEGNVPQPYLFVEKMNTARTPITVSAKGVSGAAMLDGDTRTFAEFTLPESGQGQTQLTLVATKPMTLSGMSFLLDQFVALPTSIEIRATTSEGEKIVLAKSQMTRNGVTFPRTVASEWNIMFTYGQLLRVSEIVLNDETAGVVGSRNMRFLAQPGHSYRIYYDADRSVYMNVGESGNLSSNTGVLRLASVTPQINSGYVLADTDKDSVPDIRDNCVSTANADQVDIDGNGRGDVCDDFDRDGVANNADNCPNNPNYNQSDVDGDKIGDICDSEESRITEKYSWLPMAGVSFAGFILVVLFAVTARGMMKKEENNTEN